MKNKKNFFLLITLILTLNGCAGSFKPASLDDIDQTVIKVKNSKLILLDIYHNKCKSCQIIEPVILRLKEQYSSNPDIAFLKYDLSNPITILHSRKIAKELGLEDVYKSQRFSGIVLIINTQTKDVLYTLAGEYNIEKYNELIKELCAGSC